MKYEIYDDPVPFWAHCSKCKCKIRLGNEYHNAGYAIVFTEEEIEKDELDRKGEYCCIKCLDKMLEGMK